LAEGHSGKHTKILLLSSISSQFWGERILCGTHMFLISLLYFSSLPNRVNSLSLFNFSLPSLSLLYFYHTKYIVRVCLFPKKEEGKIVMGGKDDGKVNFSLVWNNNKKARKESCRWDPHENAFHALMQGK